MVLWSVISQASAQQIWTADDVRQAAINARHTREIMCIFTVEIGGGGQSANWRVGGVDRIVTALEDPLQHTAVFAVTGPQPFAAGILSEPVYEINFRQL